MAALAPHGTATDTSPWSGPDNEANLNNDGDESYYRGAFAWQDDDGDEGSKSSYKFIHHFVGSDGAVGAASTRACVNGIAVLNGGRGGTTIPSADRRGVYNHLARHLRDAGEEPPELMDIGQLHRFRGTPTSGGLSSPVKVNRALGVIENVSIFQAGVEALGHGVMGDAITLGMLTELGNGRKQGIKSRLGHPGMSEDGTAKQIGRLKNFRVIGNKAVADLHLLDSARKSPKFDGDVVEWLMDYAEEAPEDFGLSVVIMSDAVWRRDNGDEVSAYEEPKPDDAINELPLLRPVELSAADIVDEPAANRDGLFHALNDGRYSARWAAEMFDEIDDIIGRMGMSYDKAYKFAMRYFSARGVNFDYPAAGREMEVNMGAKNMLATEPTADIVDDYIADEPYNEDGFEEVELSEVVAEPVVESRPEAAGNIQQLAEALRLGEIVSLVGDLAAQQATLLESQGKLQEEQAAIRAQLDELTDALADSHRSLSRANGFPVVTEEALSYDDALTQLLGIERTVIDEVKHKAPAKEELAADDPSDVLGIGGLMGRPTSRQSENERIAKSLLNKWGK